MAKLFGLAFPRFQATQRIHAQNPRPELSGFLSNFAFLNPKFIHGDFLLAGETKIRILEEDVLIGCSALFGQRSGYFPHGIVLKLPLVLVCTVKSLKDFPV